MPAPVQVSPDQVAAAAAQLTAQGRRVTGNSLRGVIGQGRPERLAAVWAEQQGEQPLPVQEEPAGPALPPAIADHLAAAMERQAADLRGMVAQAWARASDVATQRVQAEVDAARARVAELEDDAVQGTKNLDAADERAAGLADELLQERRDREAERTLHAEELRRAHAEAIRARADADAIGSMLQHLQETVSELVRRVPPVPAVPASAEPSEGAPEAPSPRRGRRPATPVLTLVEADQVPPATS